MSTLDHTQERNARVVPAEPGGAAETSRAAETGRATVALRVRGPFDALVARRLEREVRRLVDGGERRLLIDLRAVERLDIGTPAILWAIHRYGRARRAIVRVRLGETPAAQAIDRAGLLAGMLDRGRPRELFFDWTR